MGLDIDGIKIIREGKTDDTVFVYEGFERSLKDEEIVSLDYDDENWECVADGISMSYGSYNGFRRVLAEAALNTSVENVWKLAGNLKDSEPYPSPLFHILNFADNEGFIGPSAVKELDSYFDERLEYLKEELSDDEYYMHKVISLAECIKETAKENGYLRFG